MNNSIFRLFAIVITFSILSGCGILRITEEYEIWEIEDLFEKSYQEGELSYSRFPYAKLDSVKIDESGKKVNIYFDKTFSFIPFRIDTVESIYNETDSFFSEYLEDFDSRIYTLDYNIRDLIPNFYNDFFDTNRIPKKELRSNPVTFNRSKNLKYAKGLYNRNIALWHSHGWYYNHRLDRWLWQRARLFQTVEDLGPMSFTIPFLIPMLENAGANVFIPRERDYQLNEIIIDDYHKNAYFSKDWGVDSSKGFSLINGTLKGNENPFLLGGYHYTYADSNNIKSVEYIPSIPETGEYSVYISYQSNENSAESVLYSVYHSGGRTDFEVNQKIGGGTWIHLGKFNFLKGADSLNSKLVVSSILSENGKIITTDAVRFGGGYGLVERNGSTSGKPKFVEGARYYLQFSGMPDTLVYSLNEDSDDYKDDYQSRGEWVNYLDGAPNGPNRDRLAKGLGIPMDASIAFHTDAGISDSDTTIGTLMIYSLIGLDTTRNFPEGYSRLANRDFADLMQTQIVNDIRSKYDNIWNRRQLRDAFYSEAARPNVPAALLELASHQNFLDARFMSDPMFRFDVSRAIYKSAVKYLSSQNNSEYAIQPLPVTNFSMQKIDSNSIRLTWSKQEDPLEPTASPKKYMVYKSVDNNGFNNGTLVDTTYCDIRELKTDVVYNFKVTAVNEGGESFPSEILSCGFSETANPTVLIINCFDRTAPPAHIETESFSGFLNNLDQGVPFHYDINFTGEQHNFTPASEWKTDDIPGHGASYADFENKIIAGNTFDYPRIHGKSLLANGFSFISSSDESAAEGNVELNNYEIIDLIIGEEKTTKWTKSFSDSLFGSKFEIFPEAFISRISEFLEQGGSLFISGSYIGSDVFLNPDYDTDKTESFKDLFKFRLAADHAVKNGGVISAASEFLPDDFEFRFVTELNDTLYNAEAPDAMSPVNGSRTLLRYKENYFSAAIGYKGDYNLIAFGFPFETIESEIKREKVMNAVLNYLRGERPE